MLNFPSPIPVSTATRLAIHMFVRLSISLLFTTPAAALEATHVPSVRAVPRSADFACIHWRPTNVDGACGRGLCFTITKKPGEGP